MKDYEITVLLPNTTIKAFGSQDEVTAIFKQYRQDKETPIRTRIIENGVVLQEKMFGEEQPWSSIDEEWECNQPFHSCDVYKVDLHTHFEDYIQSCKKQKRSN